MSDSPAVVLYNEDGVQVAVKDGVAIPANTGGVLVHGSDGTNARVVNVDSSGAVKTQGSGATGSVAPTHAMQIGGTDGTNLRAVKVDGTGAVACMTLQQAIISGLVSGEGGFANGRVATPSTTAITLVYRTAYTEPTAASQCRLNSSSSSDTSGGTGAQKVKVTYYDGSMNGPFEETVVMNGTTDVTMTGSARFIERLDVVEVGSNGVSVGTITIKTNAGATIGTMVAGEPASQWAHHYVPSGKTCYVDTINGRAVTVNYTFFVLAIDPFTANDALKKVGPEVTCVNSASGYTHMFTTPAKIIGPARVVLACHPLASGTSAEFFGNFSWYML